jgi:hypothetical protein
VGFALRDRVLWWGFCEVGIVEDLDSYSEWRNVMSRQGRSPDVG